MINEPIEAEIARPPVYTDKQEHQLANQDLEPESSSSSTPTLHDGSPSSEAPFDVEQGSKEKVLVKFEPGAREDPREWSKAKKWQVHRRMKGPRADARTNTMSVSTLCLAVALGSAMPTGDLPGPAEEFGVINVVSYLSITLFVVGFGVGPLLFAPLSELFGRKPIYAISMFFYFIFTLPSALAPNIATMLAGRMIAGIASSAPMTNVGGSIGDVWSVEERGVPMAIFSAMGPCLGPLFGGWIAYKTHQWRWIYWVLFIIVGVVFLTTLIAPETLGVVLLKRKAAKKNKEEKTDIYVTEHQLKHVPLSVSLKAGMIRPFQLMFLEPIILAMSFFLSFVYSLLYATFFAFPIAFEEIRGWNMGMTGVSFVSIILGILLAMCVMPIQERLYKRHCVNGPVPEARLYPMMLGAIILPISLFILAFTSYPGIIWVGPCVAGVLFGFSMVIIYISANSYIVDSYANYAASAIAAKTLMRSLIGASVPLWITQMFHHMGFQYAGLLLALISCVIAPIPYIFYFKRGKVRERSTRAVKA